MKLLFRVDQMSIYNKYCSSQSKVSPPFLKINFSLIRLAMLYRLRPLPYSGPLFLLRFIPTPKARVRISFSLLNSPHPPLFLLLSIVHCSNCPHCIVSQKPVFPTEPQCLNIFVTMYFRPRQPKVNAHVFNIYIG